MSRATQRRRVTRVHDGAAEARADSLAVEEPLEIRLNSDPLAVTMRTPGHDVDLALGFLVSEGIARSGGDVHTATSCGENVVDVTLAGELQLPDGAARNFYTTSSCGICGKASIDAVRTSSPYDVSADPVAVDAAVLTSLPDRL